MLPSVLPQTTGPVPGAPPADVPGGVPAAQGAAFDTALAQACTPAEDARTRAGANSALPKEAAAGPGPQASGVASAASWWRALMGEAAASVETDAAAAAAEHDAEKVSEDEKESDPQAVAVLPFVPPVTPPPAVVEAGHALPVPGPDAEGAIAEPSGEGAQTPRPLTDASRRISSGLPASAASTGSTPANPSEAPVAPDTPSGALREAPLSEDTAATDGITAPALRASEWEGSPRQTASVRPVPQEPPGAGVSAAAGAQDTAALAPATTTTTTTTATTAPAPAAAQAGPPPAAVPVQTGAVPREESANRADHAVVMPEADHGPVASTASSSPDAQTDTRERGQSGAQPHQSTPVRADVSPSVIPAGPALMLLTAPDGTFRLFPAAPLSPLPSPAPSAAETADNIERLVGSMRVMTRDQVSQATIHLRPEHFGEVSINVRVEGKAVTAVIQTDSPQVREWLQAQEGTLRTGLAEQGLQLDRLHVSRDPRHERRDAQHQQPDRRRQRRRDEPQTGTFEIAV